MKNRSPSKICIKKCLFGGPIHKTRFQFRPHNLTKSHLTFYNTNINRKGQFLKSTDDGVCYSNLPWIGEYNNLVWDFANLKVWESGGIESIYWYSRVYWYCLSVCQSGGKESIYRYWKEYIDIVWVFANLEVTQEILSPHSITPTPFLPQKLSQQSILISCSRYKYKYISIYI